MKDLYKLSPEKHEEILSQIMHDVFKDAKSFEHPEIFILGGQPGAGKSTLIKYLQESGQAKDCLIINGDEYRNYHPHVQEIFQRYPQQMAEITDMDVRDWTQRVFQQAIKNRNNIIFEGTMRTNQICNTIRDLHEQGYKVNINVLAVNYFESKLSIYSRFEDLFERGEIARYSPPEAHDETYNRMLDTLQQIEDERQFDTITIYSRNKEVILRAGRDNPKIDSVFAILRHRDRVWEQSKLRQYRMNADNVLKQIQTHDSPIKPKKIIELKDKAANMSRVPAANALSSLIYSLQQARQE